MSFSVNLFIYLVYQLFLYFSNPWPCSFHNTATVTCVPLCPSSTFPDFSTWKNKLKTEQKNKDIKVKLLITEIKHNIMLRWHFYFYLSRIPAPFSFTPWLLRLLLYAVFPSLLYMERRARNCLKNKNTKVKCKLLKWGGRNRAEVFYFGNFRHTFLDLHLLHTTVVRAKCTELDGGWAFSNSRKT